MGMRETIRRQLMSRTCHVCEIVRSCLIDWVAGCCHRAPRHARRCAVDPGQAARRRVMATGRLTADPSDALTAARADELRDQIQHLTTALTKTEARLADLATTRDVIAELAPASGQPAPPETNTAYQAMVKPSTSIPIKSSEPVSRTNASACPPTRHPSTSPAAASDASPAKASSLDPNEAATRNGLNAHSKGSWGNPMTHDGTATPTPVRLPVVERCRALTDTRWFAAAVLTLILPESPPSPPIPTR